MLFFRTDRFEEIVPVRTIYSEGDVMKRKLSICIVMLLALTLTLTSAFSSFAGDTAVAADEQQTDSAVQDESADAEEPLADSTDEAALNDTGEDTAVTEDAEETSVQREAAPLLSSGAASAAGDMEPAVQIFTVTFYDGLGNVIGEPQSVESGQAAAAPANPVRAGYTFTGWDKDFSNVTEDLTVTALWKKNPHVHAWSAWATTVKPTYFKAGKKVRKCSCGQTQSAAVAKLTAKSKWVVDNGRKYYFDSKGKLVTGWKKIKAYKSSKVKWCYFNTKGVFRKSISKNTKKKWVKVDGLKFYFGKKKKPVGPGFNFIGNKLYHMNKRGALMTGKFKASNGKTYSTGKSGAITGLEYYKYKYKSFVLVDISKQNLRFYKNGKKVLSTSVITGKKGSHDTPTGTFKVRSKQRNISLVGPTWNAHVSYWMAFIGSSYGMHDANWRSSSQFSNHKTYKSNGSHGCINMKYSAAKKLYKKVKVGTPVIVQK